ncbi:LuxR C-terminal-related transcriptional regulator [Gordonia neofelifaecis]|uniref:LuxR family transcriptional regulator n=1 Tax=Gordonia neofelifaecis NRRL B-59395 TaxID=644548 RepID=F1YNN6_9ACTN|nr:LuxR C-terminal-related transcriptional regulator [Gordonia neofelifaecis]EGD53646.1 LuxR family transcriptional regulator [Gordonia neofelifaecis NRRL B-59395]
MTELSGAVAASQFRPPLQQPGHLARPRVIACLDKIGTDEPTVMVVAPSGYGKTSAVAEWASQVAGPVVWVTLGRFDTDAARISATILRALRSLSAELSESAYDRLRRLDPETTGPAAAFDAIASSFSGLAEPVRLVVDDAQVGRDALNEGLLGALIHADLPGLRLVVVGTSYTELALSRLALIRPHAVIRAYHLAFDAEEVAAYAASSGTELDHDLILAESNGWPIAVRLIAMTGVRPDPADGSADTVMQSYIRDHVLASVPAELAEFALVTSACQDLTIPLAAAVSGADDADDLLEQCVRAGLFIDRHRTTDGRAYRWHATFARHCRGILESSRPERLLAARLAAASHLEDAQPLTAASYLVQAGRPEDAVQLLSTRWVGLVVGPYAKAVDKFCVALPEPWNDDPRVLEIRASAHEVIGDTDYARMLHSRAESRATTRDDPDGACDAYTLLRDQTQLFLVDDRAELSRVSTAVRRRFESSALNTRDRAATLYLLGWAEIRLRTSSNRAVELLSSAAEEARTAGESHLAHRALGHLVYALAWAGRMTEARAVLDRELDVADDTAWSIYVGGSAATGAGYMAYWQNDLEIARDQLQRAVGSGASNRSFVSGARIMLALTAAASGDPAACSRALAELRAVPADMEQGLSWPAFRHVALAALFEATGHRDRAMRIVLAYENADDVPMVTVVLAGIAIRARRPRVASQMLRRVDRYSGISYVRAAALMADALTLLNDGQPNRAHEILEQALEIAAPEKLRRLFAGDGVELRQLLTAHLAWGTKHDDFIAECLATTVSDGPLTALSDRELEVYSQLRTTRTMQEIAEHLGVSINTVKTHQRAIYRKLGVASRREAVRLTH